ncbi:MAG: A/G-specific adenine glycosylase [Chloroflexi bacterium]|nr:A/G-specific adenine glycosylase [Chloroflexota bacterium]
MTSLECPFGRKQILEYRRRILSFARGHARSFPWRDSTDPYAVLVGEILLQRTSGSHVSQVFERFLNRWPTPHDLGIADEEELACVLRPLGLAKRTPLLLEMGRAVDSLGGVPLSPKALTKLPGVGRYTAHAVPIFTTNRNLPLADWVIARILRRYFGLPGTGRPNADEELWALATDIARVGRAREVWIGTLDLAAKYCRSRPTCAACPLQATCCYARPSLEPRA